MTIDIKKRGRRGGRGNFATREQQALAVQAYIRGDSWGEIGEALGCSGVRAEVIVKEALRDKAISADPAEIERARLIYIARLELVAAALLPRAIGDRNPMTGEPVAPDTRAAKELLPYLDRIAAARGVTGAPKQVNVDVTVHVPSEVDRARAAILADLERQRSQAITIEGELTRAGTAIGELTGVDSRNDRPAPPPVIGEAA